MAYKIMSPSVDWGGNGIAIEIHCGAGQILTEAGSRAQIGICAFSRRQITWRTKNVEFRQVIDVSWVINESPRVEASSFAGDTSSVLWFRHGQDVERPVS